MPAAPSRLLRRCEMPKPTRRAFVPQSGGARPSAFGPPLTEAPTLAADSTAAINIAIVGLNPSVTAVPLPEGSRNAQFSGGPDLRATGGSGGMQRDVLVVRQPGGSQRNARRQAGV